MAADLSGVSAHLARPRFESDDDHYLSRELGWLDFNARVLALAADSGQPLLERAKFLAIFSQNLDEFFQVRVAGLKDLLAAGVAPRTAGGLSAATQLATIREHVVDLVAQQEEIFLHQVVPELAEAGIRLSDWVDLDDDDRKHLVDVFDTQIFPVLTPLAVDPSHPFPYISNLSLNLAVTVFDPDLGTRRFARVKVPPLLPRFIVLPDGERFVPLEQVIAAHLSTLFPGMEAESHYPFRVIRNADLTLEEEEADDLLQAVELELRRRRFQRAVRLEVGQDASSEVLDLLQRELDLGEDDVYLHCGPLDLSGLWAVRELDRADLKDPPWQPVTQPRLARLDDEPPDVFAEMRRGDILLHHPYSSFSTSVEEFIRQAANDPHVLAIKLTLYRTSGDSPIVKSLIVAAERGKQVAVLVEVKARFDEQANIAWARALEEAGVHVIYGVVGLKTHCKTALVVRQEPDGIHRYCHVGTGNYNHLTARIYEDLGILTADEQVGEDLSQLFNFLTGFGRKVPYRKLVTAPYDLRDTLRELIRTEAAAGSHGHIEMKVNSLVDPEMIDELYKASQAGVKVDLVVRGICCLRPGVPGLSEHIVVRSIVGRYLEHSRIWYFANGEGPEQPAYYIGSADIMERNLDRRVEAVLPIDDPDLRERLREVLDVNLADDVQSWEMQPDGSWTKVPTVNGISTHERLEELALERAGRR